jgi:hypothetical protein
MAQANRDRFHFSSICRRHLRLRYVDSDSDFDSDFDWHRHPSTQPLNYLTFHLPTFWCRLRRVGNYEL